MPVAVRGPGGFPPKGWRGRGRTGLALIWSAALAVMAPGGGVAAPGPGLVPILQSSPRPLTEAVRCISGPLTRTETLFWGVANRGDAPAVVPVAVELSRIHFV